MRRYLALATAFCLMVIASVFASPANAQLMSTSNNPDRKTLVTFSDAVEIPGGKVLQPGTYFFKLLNADEGRWVVQIFDKDQKHIYATVMTVQDYRNRPTDKVVLTFKERAAGEPPAVKEWFFPGEQFGREFVYGKHRAIEIAKQTSQPVLATSTDVAVIPTETVTDTQTAEFAKTPVTAYSATGEEVKPDTFVSTEPLPMPAPTPVITPAPVQESAPATELPHTASSLPLIGLIGFFALVAAFSLGLRAKRSS
jgi:hypothetical protein